MAVRPTDIETAMHKRWAWRPFFCLFLIALMPVVNRLARHEVDCSFLALKQLLRPIDAVDQSAPFLRLSLPLALIGGASDHSRPGLIDPGSAYGRHLYPSAHRHRLPSSITSPPVVCFMISPMPSISSPSLAACPAPLQAGSRQARAAPVLI